MYQSSTVWHRVRAFPWRWIALSFTLVGVLQFFYHSLDVLARRNSVDWLRILAEELTGVWAGLTITPFIAWVTLAYPVSERRWKNRVPLYLATGIIGGFVDTTIIYGMRIGLFAALGRGFYDYGDMRVRYFMELPVQLSSIATIIVLISYSENRRQARERQDRIRILEQQVTQAQLEALQTQLHPHFLFNALNAISSVVYEDARIADQMIGCLAEFLRRVLRTDSALEVPLREELELLDLYLRIMRSRFEDRLECTVTASPDVDNALVPQLILQPLVENALRYAANPDTGQIVVSVKARRGGDCLCLEVSDRGPVASVPRPGIGVGLKNLAGRLERLYGYDGQLKMQHKPGEGTNVFIEFPYHTEAVVRTR
jgi:two-component system LytT family sensor kinase